MLETKQITKEDNADDLREFAESQVETYSKETNWTSQLKDEIFKLMLDKADGNLQWVYLVSETLHFRGEDEVRPLLDNPPENLAELYGRALDGLSRQNKALAARVRLALKWILCAYRPLKSIELAAVLSMSTPALETNIFSYIGPLVKTEGDQIRLVHASAKDYLVSPEAKIFEDHASTVPEQLAAIHAIMLKGCLDYLSSTDRQYVHIGTNEDASTLRVRESIKRDVLLEYSCNGWIQHFVEAYKASSAVEDVEPHFRQMLTSDSAVVKWLQIFHFLWNVHASSDTVRTYIGVLTYRPKGTASWADYLTEKYPLFVQHLSWEDGGRYTRWDRFMHRRHGYSGGHPLNMYQSPRVMPAIHVAAMFDYDKEVKRMIADGDQANYKGPLDGAPLHWAAAGGACKTLRALLDLGADKNAPYGRHREKPIFRAIRFPFAVPVRPGTFSAAKMLLDAGADPEHEPSVDGFLVSTALIALVEEGPDCPGAAEFALELCARDLAAYRFYVRLGTVSQAAAWHNHQLILEARLRCQPQQKLLNYQHSGTRLRAVIHDACTQNNPQTSKILLTAGAAANLPCILNYFTPLHFGVRSGGKTVNVLLDHEKPANPCIPDKGGHMPVHLAVRDNIKLDFGKFVRKGFHVDHVNGNGDTPLTIALENSNFDIAKALLDLEVDPTKISRQLRIHLPLQERDERLLKLRAKYWRPIESYAYLYLFRHLSKTKVLIPIFDHILRYTGHTCSRSAVKGK